MLCDVTAGDMVRYGTLFLCAQTSFLWEHLKFQSEQTEPLSREKEELRISFFQQPTPPKTNKARSACIFNLGEIRLHWEEFAVRVVVV